MITIPIQVSGDIWNNRRSVKDLLDQTQPGQEIMLDLCSEGPSLRRLGVTDLIDQYDLNVSITRWSNSVEQVPYRRIFCNANSHFFPMSYHYWVDEIDNGPAEFRFALFQGRSCPSRNRILYDTAHLWPGKFLLSKMRSLHGDPWEIRAPEGSAKTEIIEQWFDDVEPVRTWIEHCPIESIDHRIVQDQYKIPEVSSGEMARSLFQHYAKFNVELVCETYTVGDTFFPTEKTIRPMVGNRPFIMYGPVNYLNNLKQRGFQTFDNIWDESYDQLEGLERWKAIVNLINELSHLTDQQWHDLIKQTLTITQHNRTIVRQMIRDFKGV